jgi:pimeloyl-ACP methyl ester carboxylesterase
VEGSSAMRNFSRASASDQHFSDRYVARTPNLTVNGRTAYYAESGFGRITLMLIHGSGGDHLTWARRFSALP